MRLLDPTLGIAKSAASTIGEREMVAIVAAVKVAAAAFLTPAKTLLFLL